MVLVISAVNPTALRKFHVRFLSPNNTSTKTAKARDEIASYDDAASSCPEPQQASAGGSTLLT